MNPDAKSDQPLNLKPRVVFPKPLKTIITGAVLHNVFVLKWVEGSHIRGQNGIFVFNPTILSLSEQQLLDRAKIDHKAIASELESVNKLFSEDPELFFQPMFQRPEEDLEKEKYEGEAESGEELADLSLYFYVMVKKIGFGDTEKLIDQLNALASVEIAYPQPIPFPAGVDIPPTTPDSRLVQSYLEPAPQGIDAYYAWAFPAGKGDFAHIIDVETGWNLDHEDLPDERSLIHNHGWNLPGGREHGTAVLGILAAQENEFGVTGIVPKTSLGVDSPVAAIPPFDVPGAINRAATALPRGGIILIEQQYPFGPSDTPAIAWSGRWVPVEESQGDFDAIRNATARGIVIVEAAGNGAQDLDAPFFHGRFNRAIRDSGAILVGAGRPYSGQPESFSNFGHRVDVQGWGSNVMTLGYQNIVPGTSDVRQQYTSTFNGTSSASPIVAGAAASIQSIRRFNGLPTLTSTQMGNLLRDTGTPGMNSFGAIGPLPNLRRAIDAMGIPALPASGWTPFSDFQTDSAPVIVRDAFGGMACFVIRAFRLWWRSNAGPGMEWGPWLQIGEQSLVGDLAAVLNGAGCLQVFARGVDRTVWTTRQLFPGAGSAWSSWRSLGGGLSGDPVAICNDLGELEVFVRGFDDQLYTNFQRRVSDDWSGWVPMGSRLASTPAVAIHPDRTLTLVATFKDRSIRTRSRNTVREWDTNWRDTGGQSHDEPAIMQNPLGGVDIFVRGLDGALWQMWGNGSSWSVWNRLGGSLAPHSKPTATPNSHGTVNVFVRWQDNSVHYTSRSASLISFWYPLDSAEANLGGNINSNLTVVSYTPGRYELFARAWNGRLSTLSRQIGG